MPWPDGYLRGRVLGVMNDDISLETLALQVARPGSDELREDVVEV